MEAIKVQNISHQFKSLRALDNVTFSVQQGEIFSLLGPNGAGKTTTIRILTGQLLPASGQAWVAGFDVVKERHQVQPRIGVVFEYPNLYERMSAQENLAFYARLYGVPGARVNEMLQLTGLTECARKQVSKLSSGLKQRLLIARALLHHPQVLFLDEPTRGLDAHMAREIRTMIADLARQGITILLTTHYMEEADQLSQRVAFLDHGRVVALDTPSAIKLEYGNGKPVTLEDVFVALTGKELAV